MSADVGLFGALGAVSEAAMTLQELAAIDLSGFPRADQIERDAVIPEPGTYRYRLTRIWDDRPPCTWCMLNPSTADGKVDDATIRKCMRFSWLWGHGGIIVVNLYAYRSRDPKALLAADDPIGPDNDTYIRLACQEATRVVCGWGALPFAVSRARTVPDKMFLPMCLGVTKSSEPRHPLMLSYSTPLELYRRPL
jgi:hypothetical protein